MNTRENPLRGHLYWIRVPDEPGGKKRPALVLSNDVRNRLAADVIVVPLSGTIRPAPTHVRIRRREGGVPRTSVIKAEHITTISKSRLVSGPLGGPLSARRMVQVEKAVLAAIDVPVD